MTEWQRQQELRLLYGELDFFSDEENWDYFADKYGKIWLQDYINELLDKVILLTNKWKTDE